MDTVTEKVIWYPKRHRTLREPLLRELQTLKRYALIEVWKDEIAGKPCYVIAPRQRNTLTGAQRRAWRRFHHWFNQHAI